MTGTRHAWIDASAGIAGDMLLGALLDAGADEIAVRAAIGAVAGEAVRLRVHAVTRAGLRALKAEIDLVDTGPPERHWREIRELVGRAGLPRPVERDAIAVFARLAGAEARVHGIAPEQVHFHEAGALDAIADVVGCCAALADLGIATVSASPVALGSGSVRSRHGRLPVPVPAVAELARGWQVSGTAWATAGDGERFPAAGAGQLSTGVGEPATSVGEPATGVGELATSVGELATSVGELATPTGMALLRTLAGACEPLPPMTLEAVGVGAGTRDPAERANVVRVLVGVDGERESERLVLLEANVDDLDPRLWPGVLSGLLELGAADAWLTPIVMKKGRPAHTLSVLCRDVLAEPVRERIFRDTSTLGIRHSVWGRVALDRTFAEVAVGAGRVSVKLGHRDGVLVQVMPEFEDVAALARREGRPERLVLQEAQAAAAAAGLVVGEPLSRS